MGTGAISVHSIGLVESILPGSERRANAYWWMGPLASTRAKPQGAGAVPPREGNGACGMDAGSLSLFIVPRESRETSP